MLDVNVYHVAGMGRNFIGDLAKREKKSGMIVVSSIAGSAAIPQFNVYCATKAFVDYIVKGWIVE